MTHPLEENLTAYIDGELSPADTAAMKTALSEDAALRALEASLRGAVAATQRLSHPAPSAALKSAVLAQLAQTPAVSWWKPWLSPVRVAPIVALAAAVVLVVSRSTSEPALEPEALAVAAQMELLESMDEVGLDSADDVDLVAHLHELEATP